MKTIISTETVRVFLDENGRGRVFTSPWHCVPVDGTKSTEMAAARRERDRLVAALEGLGPTERAQALVDGLTAEIDAQERAREAAWGIDRSAFVNHDLALNQLLDRRCALLEAADLILGRAAVAIRDTGAHSKDT